MKRSNRPIDYGYTFFLPVSNEITSSTRKIKKSTFAIPAAPAAIPPNPNIAAIIAKIIKVTVQRNIEFVLRVVVMLMLYQLNNVKVFKYVGFF